MLYCLPKHHGSFSMIYSVVCEGYVLILTELSFHIWLDGYYSGLFFFPHPFSVFWLFLILLYLCIFCLYTCLNVYKLNCAYTWLRDVQFLLFLLSSYLSCFHFPFSHNWLQIYNLNDVCFWWLNVCFFSRLLKIWQADVVEAFFVRRIQSCRANKGFEHWPLLRKNKVKLYLKVSEYLYMSSWKRQCMEELKVWFS